VFLEVFVVSYTNLETEKLNIEAHRNQKVDTCSDVEGIRVYQVGSKTQSTSLNTKMAII